MTDKDFFDLVAKMRKAQRDYFKYRDRATLEYSKELERKVDAEIYNRQVTQRQMSLFYERLERQ